LGAGAAFRGRLPRRLDVRHGADVDHRGAGFFNQVGGKIGQHRPRTLQAPSAPHRIRAPASLRVVEARFTSIHLPRSSAARAAHGPAGAAPRGIRRERFAEAAPRSCALVSAGTLGRRPRRDMKYRRSMRPLGVHRPCVRVKDPFETDRFRLGGWLDLNTEHRRTAVADRMCSRSPRWSGSSRKIAHGDLEPGGSCCSTQLRPPASSGCGFGRPARRRLRPLRSLARRIAGVSRAGFVGCRMALCSGDRPEGTRPGVNTQFSTHLLVYGRVSRSHFTAPR